MAVGPVDPREVLKGVESLLGKDGELRSLEGVAKVFRWDLNTRMCTEIKIYINMRILKEMPNPIWLVF